MKKGQFLVVFLVVFALLLVIWRSTNASHWYSQAMLTTAAFVGPITHGWLLEPAIAPGQRPSWVHGRARVDLQIQLDALAVGIVPLIALLSATPAVRARRRLLQLALGILLCFLVDVTIIVLFPLLIFYQNDFTDIAGTFIGLVGFVGAPVIIWFVLAFRELRQWLPRFRTT